MFSRFAGIRIDKAIRTSYGNLHSRGIASRPAYSSEVRKSRHLQALIAFDAVTGDNDAF